jgi:S-adenosylmethionine synthetase
MLMAKIDDQLVDLEDSKEEFTPDKIINDLGLRKSIFEKTAKWGPFGNGFIWDR